MQQAAPSSFRRVKFSTNASRTASNPGLTKPAIARLLLLDMTFLLILHPPRTLQDGFFAPFEEIVLHARHPYLTPGFEWSRRIIILEAFRSGCRLVCRLGFAPQRAAVHTRYATRWYNQDW